MPPFDGPDGAHVAQAAWKKAWMPRIPCTPSEWAEKNRRLSDKSSAEAGPWRNSRIPYLVAIMDALGDDDPCQYVVFIKSSQVGATELGLNWVGWTAQESPAPMLALFPTEKLGQRWSRTRLQTMIQSTPSLHILIPDARKSDNINTLTEKDFPGGHLYIGSANIPVDLASTPVQRLLLDESDRFPPEIENEGDPVELAVRRTATWNTRRKVFENSSPTIESLSRVNKKWDESNKQRYHVPCPSCHALQVLRWDQLRYPEGEPLKAYYVCEANGCVIEEHHKTWMLDPENGAQWIAEKPEVTDVKGFHVNCLYTPIGLGDTWGQNAVAYEKAKHDPSKLKVFQNTRLGETHKDPKEKLEWEAVYARREPYKLRTPPHGVLVLTAGVDVQKNYLAIQIVGWGRGEKAIVVDYLEQPGDPTRDEIWEWLDAHLATPLDNAYGVPMRVVACAVDSGYSQHDVTNWTRSLPKHRNIFATKGMKQLTRPIIGKPTMVDVSYRGQTWKRGAEQFPLGVSSGKVVVYNRLRADIDALPSDRHIRFSDELHEDYFRGLCAEVFDPNRGLWVKVYDRNEPLDTFVLATGAAMHHNVRLQHMQDRDWTQLEQLYNPAGVALLHQPADPEARGLRLSGRFMPTPARVG